ncbi:MAG: N-acetylmuramoyl-L-alanine amidase [Lachnospiraceae bacterium]|nr:N-acetylmuramoyl-L-alanine amidase [Lachnospiraceae bacterium]MBQ2503673.1 N-acetylmuramoyl-L-alanine amidase [Lachnospiraceae bacterium]
MLNRLMKMFTALSLFLVVFTSILFLGEPKLHAKSIAASKISNSSGYSVLSLMKDNSEIISVDSGETMQGQLRIELPEDISREDVEINSDYMKRTISIVIDGIDQSYFYEYPLVGTAEHISDIFYDCVGGKGIIDISLDSVYEPSTVVDGKYLYLSFLDPHEVYDYVVVVDAGHGGKDNGASHDGVCEKDLNLAIVNKIKELFDANNSGMNIGVYYTRLDDTKISLDNRVGLANDLNADLFLSVHINSTASGRTSQINGTEVMYLVADDSGASKQFASICLDNLLTSLGSNSKGLVAGDTIKIIRTSEVPVALAEIGFITNPTELDKMNSEDYQQQAAEGLYNAILQALQDSTVMAAP